ncbi:hypothetical protein [Cerasicoccus fimbriatus]|uniref:hypothetical protein n=1 Tax=Cerasicoccus fimbriatus TaxID=3014554 RepID=UPI0022B39825|nr:hypothetical protein [Cerasicoccus sp. TK19100]
MWGCDDSPSIPQAEPMGGIKPIEEPPGYLNDNIWFESSIQSNDLKSVNRWLNQFSKDHEEGELTDFDYRSIFLRATVYNAYGKEEKAEKLYLTIGKALPNTLEGRSSLYAVRMMNNTDFDTDFEQFYALAKQYPSQPFVVWTFATVASDGKEAKYKKASVEQYKVLLDFWNPGPDIIRRNLAGQYYDLEQYPEALATVQQIAPENFQYYDYYFEARILNAMQRYGESDRAMETAISQADEKRGAYYNIRWSKILDERGDKDAAEQKLKQGIEKLIELEILPPDHYQRIANGQHYYYPAPSPDGLRTYRRRSMYTSGY